MDFMEAPMPSYSEFVAEFQLSMLQEPGDLVIIDGDLAMTKDFDLMLNDIAYHSMFRLAEHWRRHLPHFRFLYDLALEMRRGVDEAIRDIDSFSRTIDDLWSRRDRQDGFTAGYHSYAGCLVLLASNALNRFRDDLDVKNDLWYSSGNLCGGQSIGSILAAAANGFRHEDEWLKSRTPTPRQKQSQDVLVAALGPRPDHEHFQPGRCLEVIEALSGGEGFEGFTKSALGYAQNIAAKIRQTFPAMS